MTSLEFLCRLLAGSPAERWATAEKDTVDEEGNVADIQAVVAIGIGFIVTDRRRSTQKDALDEKSGIANVNVVAVVSVAGEITARCDEYRVFHGCGVNGAMIWERPRAIGGIDYNLKCFRGAEVTGTPTFGRAGVGLDAVESTNPHPSDGVLVMNLRLQG